MRKSLIDLKRVKTKMTKKWMTHGILRKLNDYTIEKFNEAFEFFQLEPVVP